MSFVLAAALSIENTPAVASPIWQDIYTGMSVRDVMSLYPKADKNSKRVRIKDFEPISGREGEVNILLKDKAVVEVVVSGDDKGCSDKIRSALIRQYGQPADFSQKERSSGGAALGAVSGLLSGGKTPETASIWFDGGNSCASK